MKFYCKVYGDDVIEYFWIKICDIGGDGVDGLMVSIEFIFMMGKLVFDSFDFVICV